VTTESAFHISPGRDLAMAGFFLAEGVAILALLHRAGRAAAEGEPGGAPPR
jgi:hypothetical protein